LSYDGERERHFVKLCDENGFDDFSEIFVDQMFSSTQVAPQEGVGRGEVLAVGAEDLLSPAIDGNFNVLEHLSVLITKKIKLQKKTD
jgi:hypothetical protein